MSVGDEDDRLTNLEFSATLKEAAMSFYGAKTATKTTLHGTEGFSEAETEEDQIAVGGSKVLLRKTGVNHT